MIWDVIVGADVAASTDRGIVDCEFSPSSLTEKGAVGELDIWFMLLGVN